VLLVLTTNLTANRFVHPFRGFGLEMLQQRGAPEQCCVVSESVGLDARTLPLKEALELIIGMSTGTLVSCIPGRLGYFEGEDTGERFISPSQTEPELIPYAAVFCGSLRFVAAVLDRRQAAVRQRDHASSRTNSRDPDKGADTTLNLRVLGSIPRRLTTLSSALSSGVK
jgi:hypothetical protein